MSLVTWEVYSCNQNRNVSICPTIFLSPAEPVNMATNRPEKLGRINGGRVNFHDLRNDIKIYHNSNS